LGCLAWVKDSEKVAIGAYSNITFGTATLNAKGSINRIAISYPTAM